MTEKLNKLLADLNVLNNKLHTYHYNVIGHDFMNTHLLLEKEYDEVFDQIDAVAEVIKMANNYPIATLQEMLSIASINDVCAKDYTSKEIYSDLVNDYTNIVNQCNALLSEDLPTYVEDLVNGLIDNYNKKVWFFNASNK